jgi:hypothetical protein
VEEYWSRVIQEEGTHWNDLVDDWITKRRDYLFRGTVGYYFLDAESDLTLDAERDVYGCWWRYLKANAAEYPPSSALPDDDPRRQVATRFGELSGDFAEWWKVRGCKLFTEQQPNPFIRLLEPERHDDDAPPPEYLVVKIPMAMRRERILSQLRVLLDAYKPGDQVRRHANSTAQQPLYPRARYEPEDYDRALRVWKVRQENPKWRWWQIGEALDISPGLKASAKDDAVARTEKHRDLGTQTRRLFRSAERLMWHALRGRFPCNEPIPKGSRRRLRVPRI